MKQIKAKITENKKVVERYYRMRIESPYLAKSTKPGQFFEVKCSGESDPLLRRPLGSHRIFKDSVEMLYEVVGKGTELLSKRKKGKPLDVIGPLGNGFEPVPSGNVILVAGGIGVAPLVALAETLVKNNCKVYVIIGAKTKSHLLCEEVFKQLGCRVEVVTEDGSKGDKGLATDVLKDIFRSPIKAPYASIYACGPNAMLKAVSKIAAEEELPCYVSLEERMACGVGACLGCPVKVKSGEYKMVCKDGPVFNAEEIAW